MSDTQAYEEMTVTSDGVTVVKRFEEDEFPVPAIAFEFSSNREEPVTVQLSDVVPEGVEVEDLGFHPEYGSEYWAIDDDEITFEKELGSGGEYTTVYGIRATGTDDVAKFLTEPEIDDVDPPLPESESEPDEPAEEVIPESDDDVVRDVISGEGEVPGLEDEDDDGDDNDEDVATLELKDPNEPDGTTATSPSADTESSDTDTGSSARTSNDMAVNGSVVQAMADEIRENNVSVNDLKLLDRAFQEVSDRSVGAGGEGGNSGVKDARVQKLQSDIADLRAYTDALEEFLEEEGTGEQLITEFEETLEEFSNDLDAMESDVESVTETVDDIESEMTAVSADVDSVEDEIESVEDEVDSVDNHVSSVESEIQDVDDKVETLESDLEQLASEVPDEDVFNQIQEVEEQLSELQEWQEQIKKTFGG